MTTNEVVDIFDAHLQEMNGDRTERVNRITQLLDFLNYNLRFTQLSDAEQQDFVKCIEGFPLTDEQKKILSNPLKSKDYYIEMWARGTYFRRCEWLRYLHGETIEKPHVQKS